MNNQPNTNTAAAAQETINSQVAPPPEKKPSKLSSILDKVGKSPLFIGKRKFITLPLFTLALAAIIAVPIVVINALPLNRIFRIGARPILDEATIQKNIRSAFEFADSHPGPTIYMLE